MLPIGRFVLFTCLALLSLGNRGDAGAFLGQAAPAAGGGQVSRTERRLGPFAIGRDAFTVVLRLQRIAGGPDGFEETVESFSIVNGRGEEHYRRVFTVAVGKGEFEETVGIWAFALESPGKRMVVAGAGGLKRQLTSEGRPVGLILYFGYVPSAPGSGLSCQVFTLEDRRLTPRSPPLTVYGTIHDLEPGSRADTRRLLADDTVKFGVWTGWFEVTVPVTVLDGLRAVPLHHHVTYGLDAFPVVAERVPGAEGTFVRLHRAPDDRVPDHVVVRKDSRVEFLLAYTKVAFQSGEQETVISVGERPWLQVKIDGREGFVTDDEDLWALGLREAG